MFGLSRSSRPAPPPEDFYANIVGRVNRLENRLERLELEHAERQVAVLGALEKVMHQLGARERARAKKEQLEINGAPPALEGDDGDRPPRVLRPAPPSTAHLAQRFRR